MALALLGVVVAGVLPAFFAYKEANTKNEIRTGSVAAAQRVMEAIRHADPATLPSSGASAIQLVYVGGREYEAVARYCLQSTFCDATSRHVAVDVSFSGNLVYSVESVFTRIP